MALLQDDEAVIEETSVTTALPAENQAIMKVQEDPKFSPSSKPGLFLGYRPEPGGCGRLIASSLVWTEHIEKGVTKPSI